MTTYPDTDMATEELAHETEGEALWEHLSITLDHAVTLAARNVADTAWETWDRVRHAGPTTETRLEDAERALWVWLDTVRYSPDRAMRVVARGGRERLEEARHEALYTGSRRLDTLEVRTWLSALGRDVRMLEVALRARHDFRGLEAGTP